MRFLEFAESDVLDRFSTILRNYIGRSKSKNAQANLNWQALTQIANANGIKIELDYETFKTMFDQTPILQNIVKNFNADGITLNVPGVGDEKEIPDDDQSQAAVDQIAASNAEQNL